MLNRRTFIKGSAMTMVVLSTPHIALGDAPKVPTIYTGGPILTMNAKNEMVEALAVEGGKILAAGRLVDVKAAAGEKAKIVDLQGKTLLPGFIDGHSHFVKGGARSSVNSAPGIAPNGQNHLYCGHAGSLAGTGCRDTRRPAH